MSNTLAAPAGRGRLCQRIPLPQPDHRRRTRQCLPSPRAAKPSTRWPPWRRRGRKGAPLWSIVNAIGSQAMRLADGVITMQAGPEIGVASTKAFTDQRDRPIPAGAVSGPTARHALTADELLATRTTWPACPTWSGRCWSSEAAITKHWRSTIYALHATSCIWAAASTTPSPWKARSSSRKSATSTPKATRPAR